MPPTIHEYCLTYINDNPERANDHLRAQAAAGWELVSGTTATWLDASPAEAGQRWRLQYVMYWRRQKGSTP